MRYVICHPCQTKVQLNTTLQIDGNIYCENCIKEKFDSEKALKEKNIVKDFDPTVCFSCSKDFGETVLNKLGEYPVCDTCHQTIKSKTFPIWVKGFIIGIVAFVFVSFAGNWRFIRAYYLLRDSAKAIESQNFSEASLAFHTVSATVPEVGDFTPLAEFYKGVSLLMSDKSEEALEAFKKSSDLPLTYKVDGYKLQSEIGIAYDRRDYPRFLQLTKDYLAYDTSAVSLVQVASAYSCLYTVQKADSLKEYCQMYLSRAMNGTDTSKAFATYVNLIEYRIATGDIIDRKQFEKKYPNGWVNN